MKTNMKVSFNITDSEEDVIRYSDTEDLREFARGFDGVELMTFGFGDSELITPDLVTGVHLVCPNTWYDVWREDEDALLREFDSLENAALYAGGTDRASLLEYFRKNMERAHEKGAEYVVFHASECYLEECFTWQWKRSDEEIADACAELLSDLFAEEDGSMALLVENLWMPGLNFRRPEIARRLLDGIAYPNKGIMLDVGHLLHTNLDLQTQEEGIAFINERLDAHGDLCSFIRGMHLQQSLTGDYVKGVIANPPKLEGSYPERFSKTFTHAFRVDEHRPFVCAGVEELIERLPLEYLTFEFISATREEHAGYLEQQWAALPRLQAARDAARRGA